MKGLNFIGSLLLGATFIPAQVWAGETTPKVICQCIPSTCTASSAKASAKAYPASGRVGTPLYLKSEHRAEFQNNSNGDREYVIAMLLRTQSSHSRPICACILAPGQCGAFRAEFTALLISNEPGKYFFDVETSLFGGARAEARDQAVISIDNN